AGRFLPLTPALSPGERENRSPIFLRSQSAGLVSQGAGFLQGDSPDSVMAKSGSLSPGERAGVRGKKASTAAAISDWLFALSIKRTPITRDPPHFISVLPLLLFGAALA